MTEQTKKSPSAIDIANYNYLIDKPGPEKTLIDFMAIATLEEKYPELVL